MGSSQGMGFGMGFGMEQERSGPGWWCYLPEIELSSLGARTDSYQRFPTGRSEAHGKRVPLFFEVQHLPAQPELVLGGWGELVRIGGGREHVVLLVGVCQNMAVRGMLGSHILVSSCPGV